MDDPANFFVISTDFCHWGTRFDFISYDKSAGSISASIEKLDRQGMYCIAEQDAAAFTSYLQKTGNTICGRHPIGVLLKAIEHATTPFETEFTKYAQSERAKTKRDSSVSYAAAIVRPSQD